MRRKLLAPFMLVFVTVLAVSSYWPDAENEWPDAENEYEDDFTLDAVFYPELQILEISFKDDTGMISKRKYYDGMSFPPSTLVQQKIQRFL